MLFALSAAAIAATVAPSASSTPAVALKPPIVNYPPASLKAGEAGRVGYSITVSGRGKVSKCEITVSSGYRRLDRATCEIMRDTVYAPATRDGQAVAEAKTGAINWAIPTAVPVNAPAVPKP